MAVKNYNVVSFINEFGDVIQPGEDVLIVTMCTKTTHVSKGRYLGSRGESNNINVVVEVDKSRRIRRSLDGEEYNWHYDWSKIELGVERVEYKDHPPYHRNPYSYGTKEFKTFNEEQSQISNAFNIRRQKYSDAQIAWLNIHYPWVNEPYTRRTTLWMNRVYPINKGLDAFVGKKL